jgi:uncharacterized protein DUF4136
MTSPTRLRLGAALAVWGLMIGGCAVRRVDSYLARGAVLASARTYAWGPASRAGTGDVRLDNNEIFQERVLAAVEKQLAARGFEKTAAAPQLLVHYHANVDQRIDLAELEPWESCAGCKPFIYDAGTIVIDLVDARTDDLLWRGWSRANIDRLIDNQQWLEEHIDETVAKIFERLPSPLVADSREKSVNGGDLNAGGLRR